MSASPPPLHFWLLPFNKDDCDDDKVDDDEEAEEEEEGGGEEEEEEEDDDDECKDDDSVERDPILASPESQLSSCPLLRSFLALRA